MSQAFRGLHHVTVIASDPQKNLEFYQRLLGQRLVKTTVNFDDPATYHLYYGDEIGSPGTVMTFFPWPGAERGRVGRGEVGAVAYAIASDSLAFWKERLERHGVSYSGDEVRFGEPVLAFDDPDGLRLELIGSGGPSAPRPWERGAIPDEHALRGFHSVSLWVGETDASLQVLSRELGYELIDEASSEAGPRTRLGSDSASPGMYLDLVECPEQASGQLGAGSVHHIALRVPDDEVQLAYQKSLREQGFNVTAVQDRRYFRSIYFREPSGVLLELATDGPGFPLDEAVAELGKHLKLPDWLEPNRAEIAARLPKLELPEYGQSLELGV